MALNGLRICFQVRGRAHGDSGCVFWELAHLNTTRISKFHSALGSALGQDKLCVSLYTPATEGKRIGSSYMVELLERSGK